ncbi:MAG: cytochrome-c peroxidase [Nitrospira sp.]|nr:cytochrome-c peroxidase [Nitrospira sp.]
MGGSPRTTRSPAPFATIRLPVSPIRAEHRSGGWRHRGRQARAIYNTGLIPLQFWDGRAGSLEEQAAGPIANPVEMAEGAPEHVVKKLAKIKGYQQQFRAVFGLGVNLQSLAEDHRRPHERTVVSTNSAFDKYVLGDAKAMDESAVREWGCSREGPVRALAQRSRISPTISFTILACPKPEPMKRTSAGFMSQAGTG